MSTILVEYQGKYHYMYMYFFSRGGGGGGGGGMKNPEKNCLHFKQKI